MKREIRVPQQKRSIVKRNNIIDAAYRVFNEKGYNNTNTVEIAKEASISTGSLYTYFIDKKDIFLETLNKYSNNITDLVINKFEEIPEDEDLFNVIKIIINVLIESHNISKNFHEEVMALSHLDSEVKKIFKLQQECIMYRVLDQFKKRNVILKNEKEKMLLMVTCIDSLSHEFIYNKDILFDKDIIIDECSHMIKYLVKM